MGFPSSFWLLLNLEGQQALSQKLFPLSLFEKMNKNKFTRWSPDYRGLYLPLKLECSVAWSQLLRSVTRFLLWLFVTTVSSVQLSSGRQDTCGLCWNSAETLLVCCVLFAAMCLMSVLHCYGHAGSSRSENPNWSKSSSKENEGMSPRQMLWLLSSAGSCELWSSSVGQLALGSSLGIKGLCCHRWSCQCIRKLCILIQGYQEDQAYDCFVISFKSTEICSLIISPSCAPHRMTKQLHDIVAQHFSQ